MQMELKLGGKLLLVKRKRDHITNRSKVLNVVIYWGCRRNRFWHN